MPSKRYLHDHPDFSDLTRVVAGERKIDPYLVEKDYWLMHTLYGLQQEGYDFQLKGGTSLSKGYGIIHRFSEDIDIHIVPPEDVQVRTSKNHDKERDRHRTAFAVPVAATLTGPGFPSGHTVVAVTLYGLLAYLLIPTISSRFWKWVVIVLAVLMMLFIGFSRLFVGGHYLTDVIAGYAVGVAWSGIVYMTIETYFIRRNNRKRLKRLEEQHD